MNDATLELLAGELNSRLAAQRVGKIFQLSRFQIAVDFRGPGSDILFVSIEPREPRAYLIERRLRDIERQSANPGHFVSYVRKRLSGAAVSAVEKLPGERILRLRLRSVTELGESQDLALIIQLTGRSSNIFLLDHNDAILESMRVNTGTGQEVGDLYLPPPSRDRQEAGQPIDTAGFSSLSQALDDHFQAEDAARRFQAMAGSARAQLRAQIKKRTVLIGRLEADLQNHGDAEKWKRFGDLLLANLKTARRSGEAAFVTDYFDPDAPEVAIPVAEESSLTEAAERYFKKYTKSRNAAAEIAGRRKQAESELAELSARYERLEDAIASGDEDYFGSGDNAPAAKKKTDKNAAKVIPGVRRFAVPDGFEILVGKRAKDNDVLTFKIARSADLWLHAADYPGSHVIVRNPNRKEIPNNVLLTAARLAAFYSDAGSQAKAAVHYTQKKYVNKPRGAAPGLVSLASFKTILVEPKVPEEAVLL